MIVGKYVSLDYLVLRILYSGITTRPYIKHDKSTVNTSLFSGTPTGVLHHSGNAGSFIYSLELPTLQPFVGLLSLPGGYRVTDEALLAEIT